MRWVVSPNRLGAAAASERTILKKRDSSRPVLSEAVHYAVDVRPKGALRSFDASPDLVLIHHSARRFRHKPIISRLHIFELVLNCITTFMY